MSANQRGPAPDGQPGQGYSLPFESLLDSHPSGVYARVLVIGSGYGGAVAAYRLAEKAATVDSKEHTHGVVVLERGREYALGEFPVGMGEVPAFVAMHRAGKPPAGNEDALFNIHTGEGVDVLVGRGLGGTSLINANVALRPDVGVFQSPQWPAVLQGEAKIPASPLWAAYDAVEKGLGVESVAGHRDIESSAKHLALKKYARALGFDVGPAPLTVRLGPRGANIHGVVQDQCTRCGNCVTGCNVGAKSTLAMNLIPGAHARGVTFFTGATALTVTPNPGTEGGGRKGKWKVAVRATSRLTRAKSPADVSLYADVVVISAGALGSTEILLRSQKRGLTLPRDRCGRSFSTNGDALAMSYAQRDVVGSRGTEDFTQPASVGPTITAVARGHTRSIKGSDAFTLEEGAIPFALREVAGEIVTTAAQIQRLGSDKLPGWLQRDGLRDPSAVHEQALERSQVFLVMSNDGARGSIELVHALEGDEGAAVPRWPEPVGNESASPSLDRIDQVLASADRTSALDRGQYVPNPAWRALPAAARGIMSGAQLGGRLTTVHPLGGCVMADSGKAGVVNHSGQVFAGDGAELHEGLYVLDGSIVPAALGINPFLTIAALAWRACDLILNGLDSRPGEDRKVAQPRKLNPLFRGAQGSVAPVIVRERLLGALKPISDRQRRELERYHDSCKRWFEYDGLVLHVETLPGETEKLASGTNEIRVRAMLYENLVPAHRAERSRMYGVPSPHVNGRQLIAEGTGSITIMAPDRPVGFQRTLRTLEALLTYLERRETLASIIRRRRRGGSSATDQTGIWAAAKAMWAVAKMHATYRDFDYGIKLTAATVQEVSGTKSGPLRMEIRGRKRLAWKRGHPRLWEALTELPAELLIEQLRIRTSIKFVVDTGYLAGDGLLKVAPEPGRHFVGGLLKVSGFSGQFARSILQSSFWEFGAPDYPEKPLTPDPALPVTLKDGTPGDAPIAVTVRLHLRKSGTYVMRLTRYPAPAGTVNARVALLVHGLAQGSLIYAHPAMPQSMAEHLHAEGYDVWLLDYRLSNVFDEKSVPYSGWTIDEIAEFDMPAAVHAVRNWYKDTGNTQSSPQIHVFAHCVGAIAISMAILANKLTNTELASLVLNAIHPWTLPSPANRLRALVGGIARDWFSDDFFNPLIESAEEIRKKPVSSIVDRFASSLARIGEVEGEHPIDVEDPDLSQAICDRMTFLYGRMWRHENTKAVHPFWKDLVGRAPGAVQRHLYYLVTHKRLLDHQGENKLLREPNINYWRGIRTLFLHGNRSDVFNPQSATRSAVRLLRVLSENGKKSADTVVGLKRFDDFGHMDVILADDAGVRTFPYISAFFDGKFDQSPVYSPKNRKPLRLDRIDQGDDAHAHAQLTPECGPVIRGAYWDAQKQKLVIRVWVEMPWINTSMSEGLTIGPAGTTSMTGPYELPTLEDRYLWGDVEIAPHDASRVQGTAKVGGAVIWNLPFPKGRLRRPLGHPTHVPLFRSELKDVQQPLNEVPAWVEGVQGVEHGLTCDMLVGSCLHPGIGFDREAVGAVFNGLRKQIFTPRGGDGLFLIGDFIYADATAGLLDPIAWRDRYQRRYRDAMSIPAVRAVLNSIPTHFAVDDHEFADNFAGATANLPAPSGPYQPWQEDLIRLRMRRGQLQSNPSPGSHSPPTEFDFAHQMARSYLHSGRTATHPFGASESTDSRLWYALDHEKEISCPVFVLDTRSERELAGRGQAQSARLMSDTQMDGLLKWLRAVKNCGKPKFIFSGSVIVPLSTSAQAAGAWRREDGWAGYPLDLAQVLGVIVQEGIQGVVFVGGDLHVSAVAKMTVSSLGGAKSVDCWQVVASGLYAPLPFVNPDLRGFPDLGQTMSLQVPGLQVTYTLERLHSGAPHFLHLQGNMSIGTWSIEVSAHSATSADGQSPFAVTRLANISVRV
jgi:cholesterol oxidase